MKRALESVNDRILASFKQCISNREFASSRTRLPRLVAVSKLKPTSSIIEAYQCGHRHFGENYIQELHDKSNSAEIVEKCPDIKFHFIGHLQSNKINKLLRVRNLFVIETLDSVKLANLLNNAIDRRKGDAKESASSNEELGSNSESLAFLGNRLRVMIQVNTSSEGQKSGIEPDQAPQLAEYILKECRWLELTGVMTIGRIDGWHQAGPNPDFMTLRNVKQTICERLPSINPDDFELSMGMSSDFEEAITLGSTSVRVGTLIFGKRG